MSIKRAECHGTSVRSGNMEIGAFEKTSTAAGCSFLRPPDVMKSVAACLVAVELLAACGGSDRSMTQPSATAATVRIVYNGATSRRTDLPSSAAACVSGVGPTHIHPSWRNFAGIPMQAVPPDRYELTFDDVPVGQTVSFRVNDVNWCDVNPTGAVLRNVSANGIALTQNTTTPGSGAEPGYAFTVSASGRVVQ